MDRKIDKNKYTMAEMIHRCLRCDKVAYEVGDGVFKCFDDKCGFGWEVIECEK
jgi:hypothetical protein